MMQVAIAGQVLAISTTTAMTTMSPVRLCFVDGTIPAARRIICDRIARLTARDGDNLADAFIAAKIGEALGSAFNWDEESIKTLHDEREAYIAIAMPYTQTAAEGSCEFVDNVLDFVTEEGALGMRKYAKKIAAKSGKTTRQIADQARAARAIANAR